MKIINILTLSIFLTIIFAQLQINKNIINKINIPRLILSSADCYSGTIDIDITSGNKSSMSYYACFASQSSNCLYKYCGNGWIANYTTASEFVQGYPKNVNQTPVFSFQINSAVEFTIKKSQNLSQAFDDLIDIAVSQYDPTAPNPRIKLSNPNLLQKSLSINTNSQSFQDFNLLKGDLLNNLNDKQKTYIPQFNFIPLKGDTTNTLFTAKAPLQSLVLSNLQGDDATIAHSLTFDSKNNIVTDRLSQISISLSNTYFDKENQNNPFSGKIKLGLIKQGSQLYDNNQLINAINSIKTLFTRQDIQARNNNIKFSKLGGVATEDKLTQTDPISTQVKFFDLSAQLLAPATTKVDSVNIQNNFNSNNGRRLQISQKSIINTNLINKISLISIAPKPVTIVNKQIIMFQKTVLGKTIQVSFIIVATLDSSRQILTVTGTIRFNFFGQTKDIQVFNKAQNVNFNWSWSKSFSGSWSFNVYVPLPPPVSFIGINFAFSASFSIDISLNANGVSTFSYYDFIFAANAGTAVNVDASAAVRAVVVEGGVYIQGTLVSLRTDPKFSLRYNYSQKQVQVALNWNFYLKAFAFKWGFFWRYWKFWSGWSGRKIIAEWIITNGIQKTFTALNLYQTYKL